MSWVVREKGGPKEGLATIQHCRGGQCKCRPKGKIKKMTVEEKDKREVDKP